MTWAMQLWNVEIMESSAVSGRQGTKDPWRHGKVCSQPTPNVTDQDVKGWGMGRLWDQSCWPRDLENKAENDCSFGQRR